MRDNDKYRGLKIGDHRVSYGKSIAFIDAGEYVQHEYSGHNFMWVTIDDNDMKLYNTITQEQYEQFLYYYPWDAIKGLRYGQSFCERFGVSNASPLYHFREHSTADRWIRDNYLVKNEG